MKLGLINSAWVQAEQPTVFGLRKTKEIGFDSIDVFVDPLDIDVRERRLVKNECDALGLPIVSLPCVAVGLIDFNPSVRAFHVERVQAYLDLAYEYEAKNVLLVVGEYIWNREVIPPAEQWRLGTDAVGELGRRAAELGLEIVLELEPFPLSLVNRSRRWPASWTTSRCRTSKPISTSRTWCCRRSRRRRSRAWRAAWATCTSPTATAKSTATCRRAAASCRSSPICSEIKKLDLGDRAISIELEYSPEPERIVEWVEEAYRETDKLLQAAGLRG